MGEVDEEGEERRHGELRSNQKLRSLDL